MSEVNALKTLRETTLAHLSQSDYEKILKAVELGGIQSLTGTASMIVKSAVLKHGTHDQSSHNPKKGGGRMGGGGGGGGTGSPATLGETHKQELAAAERNVRGAASKAAAEGGGLKDPYIGPPTNAAVNAADSIRAARESNTLSEAKGHIEIAKLELTESFEKYENENFHDAARVMYDTRANLTSILSAATRGAAVTPPLGGGISMIDLTFPGGTFGD